MGGQVKLKSIYTASRKTHFIEQMGKDNLAGDTSVSHPAVLNHGDNLKCRRPHIYAQNDYHLQQQLI